MADRRDYVALEWVKGEIDETLKQARYALEAFVETPDDTNRLEFSLSYIHQVFGTLQMVEFFGAALLAEEMEHLNQALIDGRAPINSDNLAVGLSLALGVTDRSFQALLRFPASLYSVILALCPRALIAVPEPQTPLLGSLLHRV